MKQEKMKEPRAAGGPAGAPQGASNPNPLPTLDCDLAVSHWGVYEVQRDQVPPSLKAWRMDADPSPIGLSMMDAYRSGLRITRPAVRAGWLANRSTHGRGEEPFVEVPWDTALDLVADELQRVTGRFGNAAIFGGSYGWSSAGRFHHAQSQVHRFLNTIGGYVRHTESYSLGAGRVLMPHVVAEVDELKDMHHSWEVLAAHTRLFVAFGGVPVKNAQVSAGGAMQHMTRDGLAATAAAGCKFVLISPDRADLPLPDSAVEWLPIRPNTDTAAMLAMAHTLLVQGRHDEAFVRSHCAGFDQWRDYLLGRIDGVAKSAEWAAPITQVSAARLESLALEMASTRSFVNVAWSLQRADHGEQPFWAGVGLAALLGQIGLPGGGFGVGYGPTNVVGSGNARVPGPGLPQGKNAVEASIPCARVADMLLNPGATFDYNGKPRTYPDIRLVYWAGGNPFHHHQDLQRLVRAWQKPETVVVHEQVWNFHARMADVVLPASASVERDDIGFASLEPLLVAMKAIDQPPGQARDDFAIFSDLAERMGRKGEFTEQRDARGWLMHLYESWTAKMAERGHEVPTFDAFWAAGAVRLPQSSKPVVMFEDFRRDCAAHPLKTPSGKIELTSATIAAFNYPDCPGYPAWFAPAEWLGAPLAERFPLHMLSDQPGNKLHSQLDFSALSLAGKVAGREPILISAADATSRGIAHGDVVRVFNDRGALLAGAVVSEGIRAGVVKLATGAWWDPDRLGKGALDRHGNPNTLTRDVGASRLSQGCTAQTCLVQIEKADATGVPMRAFTLPTFVAR